MTARGVCLKVYLEVELCRFVDVVSGEKFSARWGNDGLVATATAPMVESSGVDVGSDTTSERGEASAVAGNGWSVEFESLG